MDVSSQEWAELPFEQYGPRPVVPSRLAELSKVWIRVVIAAVLMLGAFFGSREVGELQRLMEKGQPIHAQVSNKYQTHGKNAYNSITYWYELNGDAQQFEEHVDLDIYGSAYEGSTILVTALPSDPKIHRLGAVTQERVAKKRSNWILGTILVALFFEAVAYAIALTTREQMRILRDFHACPTRITAVGEPTGTKVRTQEVEFVYRKPDGMIETAKKTLEVSVAAKFPVGKQGVILLDPTGNKDPMLYETITMARLDV